MYCTILESLIPKVSADLNKGTVWEFLLNRKLDFFTLPITKMVTFGYQWKAYAILNLQIKSVFQNSNILINTVFRTRNLDFLNFEHFM